MIVVFTGPTLEAAEARHELNATYLAPVAQGDIYRASLQQPLAIGIIDGYFERVPAVWHKEILWALARGIHVYGSASMGALRAAELAQFGMVGVGSIFADFRDERLEDDDEVTVAHGPAEDGYRPHSEAMVNIRRTLARAAAEGVVGFATRSALESIAKAIFYPLRTYSEIMQQGMAVGVPAAEIAAFREWLPGGRVNQKRDDALAMLRRIREDLACDPSPHRARFRFEQTIWWDDLCRSAGVGVWRADRVEAAPFDAVLDELRLEGTAFEQVCDHAALRHLALESAARARHQPTPGEIQRVADEFRRARSLFEPEDLDLWLLENNLTREQFARLMREETLLRGTLDRIGSDVLRVVPDHLRIAGRYPGLIERVLDKQRALERLGLDNPSLEDVGLTAEEVAQWYQERSGRPVVDGDRWSPEDAGFDDPDLFLHAVLRELCYLRARARSSADGPAPTALRSGRK